MATARLKKNGSKICKSLLQAVGHYSEDSHKAKKEKVTAKEKAAGILRTKKGKIYEEFPTPS